MRLTTLASAQLIEAARSAALVSYSPYSHFRVGAAVRVDNGFVFMGCNVENASYGLTMCAERVALFSAIAHGYKPEHIAVSCPDGNYFHEAMPCGACRQVIQELLDPKGSITVDNWGTFSKKDLLPHAFYLPKETLR